MPSWISKDAIKHVGQPHMNRIHQNCRARFKFIVLFTFNYFDLLRWIIVCLISGQSSVIYGETLSNLLSLFVPISRSNNTVEPNVSWDERSTSEKRPASGGKKEDCQRFSSQLTGELTMGLYYARRKCGWPFAVACMPSARDRSGGWGRSQSFDYKVHTFVSPNRWQMPTRI